MEYAPCNETSWKAIPLEAHSFISRFAAYRGMELSKTIILGENNVIK